MAITQKVLGQIKSAVATLETLYTVPGATSATCSTIMVTNQSSVATSFRISVRVAGLADTPKQYIYYDVAIPGNDVFAATMGITLAATDVVSVYATLGTLSFNLFGVETT